MHIYHTFNLMAVVIIILGIGIGPLFLAMHFEDQGNKKLADIIGWSWIGCWVFLILFAVCWSATSGWS